MSSLAKQNRYYKVVVLDDLGDWKTLAIESTYKEADRYVDYYTNEHPSAIIDVREITC